MASLSEMAKGGPSKTLNDLYLLDYLRIPVSPDEFFTNEYFIGKQGKSLYKVWRDELRYVLTTPGVYEFALTGSIGSGKTYAADCAIAYKLYCLSCLRNPQQFYDLAEGSMIAFGMFSLFKYKVATTSFHGLNEMVRDSAYFKKNFPADPKRTKDLIFPHNVYVATGANELQAIGENLFSVLIDEADFMKEAGTATERGQAEALHQAVRRRVESRFGKKYTLPPGIIILVSSKKTTDSYIERYVKSHRNDKSVRVADYAIWDAKPDKYPKERFRVWLGDQMQEGRILLPQEEIPLTGQVIYAPDAPNVRRAFEEDPIAAARDLAGISSERSYRFIMNSELVRRAVDPARKHPFEGEHVIIDYKTNDAVEDFLVHSDLLTIQGGRYSPRYDPAEPRYLHVDLGAVRDATGVAMVHAGPALNVQRFNKDGSGYEALAPTIVVDLMLRIKPPRGSQVDFSKVRQLISMLSEYGFPIKLVSFDGWQSIDASQILTKQGFNVELLSVDKTPNPYYNLRQALQESRFKFYRYEPFIQEVLALLEDPSTHKIDHPVHGSKDVADAVAACCHHVMSDEGLLHAPMGEPPKAPAPDWRPVDPQDHSWIIDKKSGDHRIVGIR